MTNNYIHLFFLTKNQIYMKNLTMLLLLTFVQFTFAQTEWHVTTTGSSTGTGTFNNPWDLQTALNHPISVLPGDVISLHGGVYNGVFVSYLVGNANNPIIVSSFSGETAVLNGNPQLSTPSSNIAVLDVRGGYVHFKNFEITHLGVFSRINTSSNFRKCDGIYHAQGLNCKFINLVIYNNPGTGINSWKFTAGTEIYGCLIYNNGWIEPIGGRTYHGPGIYVQNASTNASSIISDNTRLIKNNIIFNNYYKGCEVWSAETNTTSIVPREYVKNIDLIGNIIFNATAPSWSFYAPTSNTRKDNIFVGTADLTGFNRAKNINILDNYLYHNTDYTAVGTLDDASSLKIGYTANAPAENIVVKNNFISGRNNVLNFTASTTLTFENNTVWGRYINYQTNNINSNDVSNWIFKKNSYFTSFNINNIDKGVFRLNDASGNDMMFSTWQNTYTIDNFTGTDLSTWTVATAFNPIVNKTIQNIYDPNKFYVVLINKPGNNMIVDFSSYNIPVNTNYKVIDTENYHTVLATGQLQADNLITMNMQAPSSLFEYPTENTGFNTNSTKTPNNFGCFIVEFSPYSSANDEVFTTNIQNDGKIIFGGDFTQYNQTNSPRIARLNPNMSLDPTFTTGTGANGTVRASAIDSSNKIIIGGKFTNYNGTARSYIARLNSDGTNDTNFNIGTGIGISSSDGIEGIHAIAIQSDGKILIGGYFTSFNGTTRNSIARLNTDGTLDTSFASGFATDSAIVYSIVIQSDGRILVGGSFANYSSTSTNNIVRLNTNGTIDSTFITGTGFDNEVYAITIQPDGKILVGGKFNYYKTTTYNTFLSRLLNDGSIDSAFTVPTIKRTGEGFGVKTIKLQSDSKIVIGGGFYLVNNISRKKIARLEANGNFDTTFDPGTGFGPQEGRGTTAASSPRLNSISIQTDGKIVCGGYYTDYNQNPVKNMSRINPALIGTIARQSSLIEQNDIKNNLLLKNETYSDIRIYPIPFSNHINIESTNEKMDLIEIYSKNSSLIKSQKINSNKEQVILDELSKDYYFYKIYNNGKIIKTGKLIKN